MTAPAWKIVERRAQEDRRWGNKREMPKCRGCGHRRIYHTILMRERENVNGRGQGGRSAGVEMMVPCSMPDCECSEYSPVRVRVAAG